MALAFALAALSCGSRGPSSNAPLADDSVLPSSPASRFWPLAEGTIWAYDAQADDDPTNQGMFVTRARRLPGPRFSLTSGQAVRTVEVRADGLYQVESDTYVLKAPLSPGQEWTGERGPVRVVSVDRMVDVPAGKFVGCLETVEQTPTAPGANPARRTTITYCPDVGITQLHAEAWEGGRHQGERATLRSFGKPVVIDKK